MTAAAGCQLICRRRIVEADLRNRSDFRCLDTLKPKLLPSSTAC
jgi:hypothetical protein